MTSNEKVSNHIFHGDKGNNESLNASLISCIDREQATPENKYKLLQLH